MTKSFLKVQWIMGLTLVCWLGQGWSAPVRQQGIKLDREVLELLSNPKIKLVPEQVKIFRECKDDKAGIFFFVTPILSYLRSESFGNAGTRFFDAKQFDQAIRLKLKKEGVSLKMFCAHIVAEYDKVKSGEYTYQDLLNHILECQKICGPTLSAIASVYMFNSARYFRGLVRFNYDDSSLGLDFPGDSSQGFLHIDNNTILEQTYQQWVELGRSWRIGLDARASLPGTTFYNNELSRERLRAVEQWFTQTEDVPVSLLDRKWLGNFGPYINQVVTKLYHIESLYNLYQNNDQAEKRQVDGRDIYLGLNQSVAIYLYKDVKIHIDVDPVDLVEPVEPEQLPE